MNIYNVKEARAAVMAIRLAARVCQTCGHKIIALCDSRVALHALEKGRPSRSKAINAQCRRAAAYLLGCRLQWRFRFVASGDNLADAPSRSTMTKRGTLHSEKTCSTTPSRRPAAPRPSWRPPPGLEPPSAPLLAKSRDEVVDSPVIELAHALREAEPPPPLRDKLSQQPLTSFVHQTVSPSCSSGILEVFSGSHVLTDVCRVEGLAVLSPIDIAPGPHCNLTRTSQQEALLEVIGRRWVWFGHFGPPCTIWSCARRRVSRLERAAAHERAGVELAVLSCIAIRTIQARGGFWSIEKPRSSKLWQFELVATLASLPGAFVVDLDMCDFGAEFKKPTRIVTNLPHLRSLGHRCTGGHGHVRLHGNVTETAADGRSRSIARTAAAGRYPDALAALWARALRAAGAPGLNGAKQGLDRSPDVELWRAYRHNEDDDEIDPNSFVGRHPYLLDSITFGHHTPAEQARRELARGRHVRRGRWPTVPLV